MLLANYGSSEYVQSMSRVGSIYGNMYVLNQDNLEITDISKEEESKRATGIKLN